MSCTQVLGVDVSLEGNLTLNFEVSRWGEARLQFSEVNLNSAKQFKAHFTSLAFFACRGFQSPKEGYVVDNLPKRSEVAWFSGVFDSLSCVTKHSSDWKRRVLECGLYGEEFQFGRVSGRRLQEKLLEVGVDANSFLHYPALRRNDGTLVESIQLFLEEEMKDKSCNGRQMPRNRDEGVCKLADVLLESVICSAFRSDCDSRDDKWGRRVTPEAIAEVWKIEGNNLKTQKTLRKVAKALLVVLSDVFAVNIRLFRVITQAKGVDGPFPQAGEVRRLRRNLDLFIEVLLPFVCHVILSSLCTPKILLSNREIVKNFLQRSSENLIDVKISGVGCCGGKPLNKVTVSGAPVAGAERKSIVVKTACDLSELNDTLKVAADDGTCVQMSFVGGEAEVAGNKMVYHTTELLLGLVLLDSEERVTKRRCSVWMQELDFNGEEGKSPSESEVEWVADFVNTFVDELADVEPTEEGREEEDSLSALGACGGERVWVSENEETLIGEDTWMSSPRLTRFVATPCPPWDLSLPKIPDFGDLSLDGTFVQRCVNDDTREAVVAPTPAPENDLLGVLNHLVPMIKVEFATSNQHMSAEEIEAALDRKTEQLRPFILTSPIAEHLDTWYKVATYILNLVTSDKTPLKKKSLEDRVHILILSAKVIFAALKEHGSGEELTLEKFKAYEKDKRFQVKSSLFMRSILCYRGFYNQIGRLWNTKLSDLRRKKLCDLIVGQEEGEQASARIKSVCSHAH